MQKAAARLVVVGCVLAVLATVGIEGAASRPTPAQDPGGDFVTGKFLVAEPDLQDPRFAETVIFMVSHDAEGAMGLIINRIYGSGPVGPLLDALNVDPEVSRDHPDAGIVRLAEGGPVEPHRGFVLHSDDFEGASTRIVGGGVAVSFGTDVLEAIATGEGPRQRLVLLGYSGWSAGQLEGELARESWQISAAESSLIFSETPETVWEDVRESLGVDL